MALITVGNGPNVTYLVTGVTDIGVVPSLIRRKLVSPE